MGCYQLTVRRRWMDDNYADQNLAGPRWQKWSTCQNHYAVIFFLVSLFSPKEISAKKKKKKSEGNKISGAPLAFEIASEYLRRGVSNGEATESVCVCVCAFCQNFLLFKMVQARCGRGQCIGLI